MKHQALFVILLIALVFRVAGINQPFWYDEAYTAMLVQLPFNDMMTATINDVHPPTWYLITRAFTSWMGVNEFTLRLPALLLGLLAIYLAWRLARNFLGDTGALIVAGLMAVAPFEIYYSNEARMYALLTVAVLTATVGIIERRWWLAALGVCLTLYSHNLAIIYLPMLGLLAWWRVGFRKAATWIAIGMLPWLAWLPFAIRQATMIDVANGGYWVSDVANNKIALQLDNINALLFTQFSQDWIIPVNILITCCLVAFPIIEAIRRREQFALSFALMAFGPVVCSGIISTIWQPISIARTLAGCLPAWLCLITWWITRPRRWDDARLVLIGLCAFLWIAPLAAFYSTYDRSMGMKDTMAWLTDNSSSDDVVCHVDSSSVVLTKFYYKKGNAVILSYGTLRNQISPETINVTGIEIKRLDECDWIVYVKTPLLDKWMDSDIYESIKHLDAEVVRTIHLSKFGVRAELWKIHNGRSAADVRLD
jgi:mannosyltransferase